MKCDIVLAGVGGQGILTIAAIIGQVAVEQGIHVKQSEIHGMSQRGGSVFSHLRLSSEPILADQITEGTADMVVSMEPMEALRYRKSLAPEGVMITNTTPVINIPNYPEVSAVMADLEAVKRHVLIDGDAIAKEIGSPRSVNIVLLGAISNHLGLDAAILEEAVAKRFAAKGEAVVAMNLKAFAAGRAAK